jgi:hypothetical protein
VVVEVREDIPVAGAGVDWGLSRPGGLADRADVIEVAVGDQDRRAAEVPPPQLIEDPPGLVAGVDHEAVGRALRVDDPAVRPVGSERERMGLQGNRVPPSYVSD